MVVQGTRAVVLLLKFKYMAWNIVNTDDDIVMTRYCTVRICSRKYSVITECPSLRVPTRQVTQPVFDVASKSRCSVVLPSYTCLYSRGITQVYGFDFKKRMQRSCMCSLLFD